MATPIKLSEVMTASAEAVFEVRAVVQTGLSIGAAGARSSAVDRAVVKDAHGRFIIPGSHLKGRLRHECEKLGRAVGKTICDSPRAELMCPQLNSGKQPEEAELTRQLIIDELGAMPCSVCRLFGNPAFTGALVFADLVWDVAYPTDTIRNRVSINRRRRTAEEKRLFFVETSPTGVDLDFVGTITAKRDLSPWEVKLLLAAMSQIHALGGSKSVGSGWAEVSCPELLRLNERTVIK
jgi:CRISPR/Cas system CSM-associated protein Csm3 (group 7 of RAMP superfamily)